MDIELMLGGVSVAVGAASLWVIFGAGRLFPIGSELRAIATRIGAAVALLCGYSSWHVFREALHLKKTYGDIVEYPEYILVAAAYVALLLLSISMLRMARNIGAVGR